MTAATTDVRSAALPEHVGRIIHGGGIEGLSAISDVAACLVPLLNALGWRGTPRHLAEALPHFADTFGADDLVRVLGNLDYPCQTLQIELTKIDGRLFPCIFVAHGGPAMVVYEGDGETFTVLDGSTGAVAKIDGRGIFGSAYVVSQAEEPAASPRSKEASWSLSVAKRFHKQVVQLLAITFVTNLLALATPLFIMAVYDQVIGTNSLRTLAFLLIGIALVIGCDLALRLIRARLLAYIGSRIDMILGCAAFRQVVNLPLIMTERATIGSQISRLKQFESVREFFTGPLAGVFLDLPFVGVFLFVIALIGGSLALIPLLLLGIFLGFGALIVPATQGAVYQVGETRLRRQGFVIEMFDHLRAIKMAAAEASWSRRYRDISANCAKTNFRATQISVLIQTVAQILMLAAGIATLACGTFRVLDGNMSVGALVACMILVWRVLVPLQVTFLSLTRFEQIKQGLQQLDQLMRLEPERQHGEAGDQHRSLDGHVVFHRVSLRYTPSSEPALLGVDLRAEPGELVAITGANGAGKSTLLKLVAGLYQSQAGAVLIDGMDLRQMDPGELRSAIASVPQSRDLFHGTIAQNLRLANPTASDKALISAAHDAMILEEILALPGGFETRLTDRLQRQLSNGFKQGLMLARAYVKDSPIYLLDEPGNHLDEGGDRALMGKLETLRGRATVFIVTHRPSHLRLADRVVVMAAGRIVLNGPPGEVLPQL